MSERENDGESVKVVVVERVVEQKKEKRSEMERGARKTSAVKTGSSDASECKADSPSPNAAASFQAGATRHSVGILERIKREQHACYAPFFFFSPVFFFFIPFRLLCLSVLPTGPSQR